MKYRTLIDLYTEDNTVLNNLTLPEGYNAATFRAILLQDYAPRYVYYKTVDELKAACLIWSTKWLDSLTRIYVALTEEYNPLHNFDRHEEYTDNEDTTDNNTRTLNTTNGQTSEITDTISADNSSGYVPDNKQNGTVTTTDSGTIGDVGTGSRDLEHEGHLYGNIGITKSQEMLRDETYVRMLYNLYTPACGLFEADMLLNLSE